MITLKQLYALVVIGKLTKEKFHDERKKMSKEKNIIIINEGFLEKHSDNIIFIMIILMFTNGMYIIILII